MSKLEELKMPFKASDIEWRIKSSGISNGNIWGMCLAYITNRAVQDRLDDVFGLSGWRNEFVPTPSMSGVMCGISFKHEGEWITKWDGAQETEFEATKGGLSSSMKRAVVHLGIGRYLYNLDTGWITIVEKGTEGALSGRIKANDGEFKTFYWLPPSLPDWALPIENSQLKEIKRLSEESETKEEDLVEAFGILDIKNATKEQGNKMLIGLGKKISLQGREKYKTFSKASKDERANYMSEFIEACEQQQIDFSEFLESSGLDIQDEKETHNTVVKWLKSGQSFQDQIIVFKNRDN